MKSRHLVLLILALSSAGCDKPTEETPTPRPALVRIVEEKPDLNSMILVGEVRPRFESKQGFRVNGKIIERKVDVGASVTKGQVLARLDPADSALSATAAQADVQAAEANRDLAAAELTRYRSLFAKNFVSASALDIKVAELKSAKAKLAQVKSQARISDNQTHYTHLSSDRKGVVTLIHAEPGQVVGAGELVAQIAGTDELEVLLAIPESRINEVKLNAEISLKLWANPQKIYAGLVREISPAAETATRTFNVRVSISNADTAVKLGATARVRFSPDNDKQALGILIPSAALTEHNGKKSVWVIDANNKAQPRPVDTGQFSEDGIWVTSGLQVGEKIAVAGVHTLLKDQQVKPIIEAAP